MRRKDLKPGMYLRNTRSGNLGEALGNPRRPKELRSAHPLFVAVRFWSVKAGRWFYPCWQLAHVKKAKA